MNLSDSNPQLGLSWRMYEREAGLLADSLRSSRVTLLYAAAGASREALLRDSVAPLLGRRESDVAVDRFLDSRVVAPFIDQREPANASAQVEHGVLFSQWEGDPVGALLALLQARFPDDRAAAGHRRLADALESICEGRGRRLLIILDAFEQLWSAGAEASATSAFIEALAEAVNRPSLSVNFLLAIDDRYESRLDALRLHIPRFDDSTVRLLGFADSVVTAAPPARTAAKKPDAASGSRPPVVPLELPTLSDAVVAPLAPIPAPPATRPRRKKSPKVPLPAVEPVRTDGVYAFIESRLAATTDASEPWHEVAPPPPPPAVAPPSRSVAAADFRRLDRAPSEPPRADRRGSPASASLSPGRREPAASPAGPSNSIDERLGAVLAWCRRLLRAR